MYWTPKLGELSKLKNFHYLMNLVYDDESHKLIKHKYKQRMRRAYRRQAKVIKLRNIKGLENDFRSNKKKFWKNMQFKISDKCVNADMKNIVAHYSDIFNENEIGCEIEKVIRVNNSILDGIKRRTGNYKIERYLIKKAIRQLKVNKAAGIANIPNECYKYGDIDKISEIISVLFEKIINLRKMPTKLNTGLMTLLVKDDKKPSDDLNNTRPITLSDTISTIFEKYLESKIKEKFENSQNQLGFKANASTQHAVFCIKEQILHHYYLKTPLYITFIDFTKAFDKVDKDILCYKLIRVLPPDLWAAVYQYVKIAKIIIKNNKERSDLIKVNFGVKQGGNSSPLLFAFYIHELITEVIESGRVTKYYGVHIGIICYADDTAIMSKTIKDMQAIIKIIEDYCRIHRIKINASKTEWMVVGMQKNRNSEKLTINGIELIRCTKFKYLGVWLMSNNSNFEHLKTRKNKLINMTYMLNNKGMDSKYLGDELKSFLYRTYCRPVLNYGLENTFMSENALNDLKRLESLIMKKKLHLNKYCSSTKLFNALKIMNIKDVIIIKKLKFFVQLSRNLLTRDILEAELMNLTDLHTHCLIKEIITFLGINTDNITLNELTRNVDRKIGEIELKTYSEMESDEARAIRFFMSRRTNEKMAKCLYLLLKIP